MQRLDALGIFFVVRVQRIQLFFVDDVEEPFAHHGQLQAQAAFAFAFFRYFGNNAVETGWNLRVDQPAVGVEQADGWIQRAVARVSLLRRFCGRPPARTRSTLWALRPAPDASRTKPRRKWTSTRTEIPVSCPPATQTQGHANA